MNLVSIISFAVLLLSIVGVYYLDATATAIAKENGTTPELFQFTPPYYFQNSELISYFTAFFFAFLFSLLFFGFGSIIAAGIEGLKFGTILTSILFTTTSTYGYVDLLFIIPQILAILAASQLGQGVINDYHARGNINEDLKTASVYFVIGLILTGVFYFIRVNIGV